MSASSSSSSSSSESAISAYGLLGSGSAVVDFNVWLGLVVGSDGVVITCAGVEIGTGTDTDTDTGTDTSAACAVVMVGAVGGISGFFDDDAIEVKVVVIVVVVVGGGGGDDDDNDDDGSVDISAMPSAAAVGSNVNTETRPPS